MTGVWIHQVLIWTAVWCRTSDFLPNDQWKLLCSRKHKEYEAGKDESGCFHVRWLHPWWPSLHTEPIEKTGPWLLQISMTMPVTC